ncbi:MAG: hypothetical protein ACKVWR_06255 [Acidimicrobiales bacterium]
MANVDKSTDLEAQLHRQLLIWTNMYGPARAAELVGEARVRLEAAPERPLREVVDELDPEDAEELAHLVVMRIN